MDTPEISVLKDELRKTQEALDKLVFVGSKRQRAYLFSYRFNSLADFDNAFKIIDKFLKDQYILRDLLEGGGDKQACWRKKIRN